MPHRSIYTALRPWTFSASLAPVVLGAVLSYKVYNEFNVVAFLITLVCVLAVNGAGNMVNTYFDFMRERSAQHRDRSQAKNDQKDVNDQTLVEGQFNQTQVVNIAAYFYGSGMVCLWLLMWLSPARSDHLAAMFFGGLSASFLYTGGIGLKYYVLGDLLVMFTFGPLSVLFSFLVQCGEFSMGPLLLALPLALSTEAILHSKHVREMDADRQAGVVSLAILLGKQGSYFLFTLLLFSPYLIFVLWGTQYSLVLGLPLLSMPYAFQLERTFREKGPDKSISTSISKLNSIMSILFVIGCLLAPNTPFLNV